MWFKSLSLDNIRCFKELRLLKFSKSINLFIGANNIGKSTIIKSLLMCQENEILDNKARRINENNGLISIEVEDDKQQYIDNTSSEMGDIVGNNFNILHNFSDHINSSLKYKQSGSSEPKEIKIRFPKKEPENLIYPFLSKRKVDKYAQNTNAVSENIVTGNFQNITSKISRIQNPENKYHHDFKELLDDILDFKITSFTLEDSSNVGIYIDDNLKISIENLGDGVPHIISFIESLIKAKDKIFLIEELENDLHPEALKKLLKIIIEKSKTNQFFIATHSNIVVKYLGSVTNSKLFEFNMKYDNKIPTAYVKEIENIESEKIRVLYNLGYDLYDFYITKGWIILEEYTACVIIRDCLVPLFAEKLKNEVRIIGAQGVENAKNRFEDFNRNFLFIHLEPVYKNKAWVIVDGDDKGKDIIKEIKKNYCSSNTEPWNEDQFLTFNEADFEIYYPKQFQEEANKILSLQHGKGKQVRKMQLSDKVINWFNNDKEEAKKEFKESAQEVIDILKEIERKLYN